jgi:hypothetical protein
MTDLDTLWAKVRELMEQREWTEAKLTVWARKNKGCGPKELDIEAVRALKMHLESM